ncbi:MAG: hypothetical protein Q8S11_15855 [Daejeonella sp.]|uniref:hypothetical protein n=1 Tax=Daejeonella sp. TaxID=2805397 RepID=UPI00273729B1|nr:hypothetical protein [Daejeonella sp.]MDP3469816.1 hypothetical protein [Daejeonella sp.]
MKSPKKVTKSGGPKKSPDKKKTHLSDPIVPVRPILDDEDEFDLPIDDDLPAFDVFDDDDDEDDF